MTSVLVIGDIHAKKHIFFAAESAIERLLPDEIVLLGDLEDDFLRFDCSPEEYDAMQIESLDECYKFCLRHNVRICWGNHDISYLSGFHTDAHDSRNSDVIKNKLHDISKVADCRIVHRIGRSLFSHAGLTAHFLKNIEMTADEDIDEIIDKVNSCSYQELSTIGSPIWHRILWNPSQELLGERSGYWHYIGHTPVERISESRNATLCDTFSTNPKTLLPLGSREFILIPDTNRPSEYKKIPSGLIKKEK